MKKKIKKIRLFKKTQVVTGVFLLVLVVVVGILAWRALNEKKIIPILDTNDKSEGKNNIVVCEKKRLLTGKCFAGESEKEIYAVMIDNHPDAMPQFGLESAEVIYSTLAEGGITRFVAIFSDQSGIDKIGPVRSARPYFLDLALPYQPLYVHVGGSNEALAKINDLKIKDLNEMTSWGPLYFSREADGGYEAPHNTFTTLAKMKQAWCDFGFGEVDFEPWQFAERDLSEVDEDVDKVTIDYAGGDYFDVIYKYSSEEGVYHRYQNNTWYQGEGGNKIDIDNVIIQYVPRKQVLDNVGRLAIDMIGEGEAVYLRDGKMIPMAWQKDDTFSLTRFFDEATGEEMKFVSGNFWIEVVPDGHDVSFE